jgi:HEAT repeat protein
MSDHEGSALHGTEGISAARRTGAAAAAGHSGDEQAAKVALADPDPGVRAAGLGALIRIGIASLADLEHGFADSSPVVRRRTAELAWRVKAPAAALWSLVAGQLEDEEGEVVEAVCFCLGELQPQGVTAALAEVAAHHSDPLCRESAVAALGAIGDPAALPVILTALGDRPQIRRRAVLALASYEGAEVDEALARSLTDRDWQVRQAAEDLTGSRPGSS